MVDYQVIQERQQIKASLSTFEKSTLYDATIGLFNCLGYDSGKKQRLEPNSPDNFVETWGSGIKQLNKQQALFDEWKAIDLIFQLTDEEFGGNLKPVSNVDRNNMLSYLLFALELKGERYARGQLAAIARGINKLFPMPVLILFRHSKTITIAIVDRRIGKRDETRDVLEKVTLIKDINYTDPHRAHVDILSDLAFDNFRSKVKNFQELHEAWSKVLSSSELNKKFYSEIANWYFWAQKHVKFPKDAGKNENERNATCLIRLITRLIFVWFIKEKGLIPNELFDEDQLTTILNCKNSDKSPYYKAILQNLFFACLNTGMDKREFRKENKTGGMVSDYMIHNRYRYRKYFSDPDKALGLFKSIPFVNGGLFECLDSKDDKTGKEIRIDGFSDLPAKQASVPDDLFFGEEHEVDISRFFDGASRYKRVKVRGIIKILESYKFTVAENTPLEEEVALDPELLGRVFENLLAAYNPETKTTARKATGSYYTPREIVDYMVNESVLLYLQAKTKIDEDKLRVLLNPSEEIPGLTSQEKEMLVDAIDNIKVIDPACGSGAFLMGTLHKLVHILKKLDPDNKNWKEKQVEKLDDLQMKKKLEEDFENNPYDYGRKLALIQNCIYGVDIQPIAVQIAKLRFFISLIVDQVVKPNDDNLGILPLPNLETKFVAANALISMEKPKDVTSDWREIEIKKIEDELLSFRKKHFSARTYATKKKYRDKDKELRLKISKLLLEKGFPLGTTNKIANWDPYDQNAFATFFDPEWMFGIKDGFNVVIANPPYIGEKGHRNLFKQVKTRKLGRFYLGKMDYFYFFFHLALDIGSSCSVISFITTNYYITATGGYKLRKDFKERSTLVKIINFNELRIFDAAPGQHNMITVLTKGYIGNLRCLIANKSGSGVATRTTLESILNLNDATTKYSQVTNNKLYEGSQFYIVKHGDDQEVTSQSQYSLLSILDKINNQQSSLSEICKVNQGIITGGDKVTSKHISKHEVDAPLKSGIFVLTSQEISKLCLNKKDSLILRPWFKNSDIKKYYCRPTSQHSVIYTCGETKELPLSIKNHLNKFKVFLNERREFKDGSRPWYQLHWARTQDIFESPKIVAPQRSPTNTFGYNEIPWYASADVYFITQKDSSNSLKYVLALLNSKLYYVWLYYKGKRKGETLELYQKPLSEIPIKKISTQEQKPFISLADKILDLTKNKNYLTNQAKQAKVKGYERQIDQLVYKLYGLTEDEIKIVEGVISDSQ